MRSNCLETVGMHEASFKKRKLQNRVLFPVQFRLMDNGFQTDVIKGG